MASPVGIKGEEIAANYLISHGFSILAKNYRTKFGELDIVAENNGTIHFVEVKTRSSTLKGKPYEAVNFYKTKHLMAASTLFLLKNGYQKSKLSLDVISIVLGSGREPEIKLYENVTR